MCRASPRFSHTSRSWSHPYGHNDSQRCARKRACSVILGSESAAFHQQRLQEHAPLFDPLVRERLEASSFYSALDYIRAVRVRTLLMEEMGNVFEKCNALMLPAGNAAPRLEVEIVGTDARPNPPPAPRPDSFNLANLTGIPSLVLPCGLTAAPPEHSASSSAESILRNQVPWGLATPTNRRQIGTSGNHRFGRSVGHRKKTYYHKWDAPEFTDKHGHAVNSNLSQRRFNESLAFLRIR